MNSPPAPWGAAATTSSGSRKEGFSIDSSTALGMTHPLTPSAPSITPSAASVTASVASVAPSTASVTASIASVTASIASVTASAVPPSPRAEPRGLFLTVLAVGLSEPFGAQQAVYLLFAALPLLLGRHRRSLPPGRQRRSRCSSLSIYFFSNTVINSWTILSKSKTRFG